MTEPATGERTFLQALKVPFDLKGTLLGAMAYAVVVEGLDLMGASLSVRGTPGPLWFHDRLRDVVHHGEGHARIGVPLLLLAVAAVFGVACCRVAAMRIARDEGVGAREALRFAIRSLGSTVAVLLFFAAAILFFYGCNVAAGFAAGVPVVGPVLLVVLYPLAILSTLILFLLLFGTAFGLPLVFPALATERNGALDAASRSFSYVFSRPALYFLFAITVTFFVGVLAWAAGHMEELLPRTMTAWLPEGMERIGHALSLGADGGRLLLYPSRGLEGSEWMVATLAFAFGALFHLLLMGYVVYYAFGGATAAYFALRRDVDGTEDEEIWVEGEEDGGFGEPEPPAPAPGDAEEVAP